VLLAVLRNIIYKALSSVTPGLTAARTSKRNPTLRDNAIILGGDYMSGQGEKEHVLELVAKIVSAHVTNNSVTAKELPELIRAVHQTFSSLGSAPPAEPEKGEPAVPVKRSVFADHIVCLDCGASFKMIKRHLTTEHRMTPEQYRAKWGLPSNYPMVATNYAARRSALAKEFGLGRTHSVEAEPKPKAVPKVAPKRGR
jgi:predicted transcriptional regulator